MIEWITNIFRRRAKAAETARLVASMREADAREKREKLARMQRTIARLNGDAVMVSKARDTYGRLVESVQLAPRPVRASPQRAAAYAPAPVRSADTSSDDVYLAMAVSMLASTPAPAPASAPCSAPSFSSGGGGDYGGGGASGSWDSGSSDSSSSSSDSGSSSSSSSSD